MGTANFCLKNARGYYVTEREIDDLYLEGFETLCGWSDISRCKKYEDYFGSYPGLYIMEKDFSFVLPGGSIAELTAKIVYRAGYYEAANIDWEISAGPYVGKYSDYSDGEDFSREIAAELLEQCYNFDGWNKGFCAIMRPRFVNDIQKAVETVISECEQICAAVCDDKYICIGRASNGEAFYEKAR